MRKIILIIAIISCSNAYAQVSGYIHIGAETKYDGNMYTSLGFNLKELTVGYYYQKATINGEGKWSSTGLFVDLYLGNVDEIVYFSAGSRIAFGDNNPLNFSPHAIVCFRINDWVEVPIIQSYHAGDITSMIGLKFILQ
jgi:hypothetical protein